MTKSEWFWEQVAIEIEQENKLGPLSTWKKDEIEDFLKGKFAAKIEQQITHDEKLAQNCKLELDENGQPKGKVSITYTTFLRIFKYKNSSGDRTNRNLFAVYLGYDSFSHYLEHHPDRPFSLDNVQTEKGSHSARKRLKFLLGIILPLLVSPFLYKSSRIPSPYLLVRHDEGISILNKKFKEINRIAIGKCVTGIDFDPSTNQLFWSCVDHAYFREGISSCVLNDNRSSVITGTTRLKLTDYESIPRPCGIALDPTSKRFYVASYEGEKIFYCTYEGEIIDSIGSTTTFKIGKPSSVELDTINRILYWTDVQNHRIGYLYIDDRSILPKFIDGFVGKYPDGLSIDYTSGKLYWAAMQSKHVGWLSLTSQKISLVSIDQAPAAVEIDPHNKILFISTEKSNVIIPAKVKGEELILPPSTDYITIENRTGVMRVLPYK